MRALGKCLDDGFWLGACVSILFSRHMRPNKFSRTDQVVLGTIIGSILGIYSTLGIEYTDLHLHRLRLLDPNEGLLQEWSSRSRVDRCPVSCARNIHYWPS